MSFEFCLGSLIREAFNSLIWQLAIQETVECCFYRREITLVTPVIEYACPVISPLGSVLWIVCELVYRKKKPPTTTLAIKCSFNYNS